MTGDGFAEGKFGPKLSAILMDDFLGLLLVNQIRAKIKDLKVTFDLTILACIYENT